MTLKTYRPPATVSREEFLVGGSDADFRRSIYAIVQCAGRLLACRDAFGRELDLTPSQFAVLMGVGHTQGDGGVTIRDLADYVGLASTHVTTEVRRLERAGLLTKRPSETDRRSVCVSLLPHGENEISRVVPFIRLVNDALFQDIDAASLGIAHRVARQLILNSENAMAAIRRHVMVREATATFGGGTEVTSRAASDPSPEASRPTGRAGTGGSGRHRKVAA